MVRLRRIMACIGLLATAATLVAGASVAGSSDHGSELWAGQWKTSTGGVAWRAFTKGDLQIAKSGKDAAELFNKLPCKSGPHFYRGGYTAGSDRGKIMGCGTPTKMQGRWLSNAGGQNGSYTIRITSRNPLKFTGTFRQDDGVKGAYTGTWASHFDGDGCCPTGGSSTPDNSESAKPTATVKRLQSDLSKAGLYQGPLDGRNSAAVTTAVKDFQQSVGIPIDGKCLSDCQRALKKLLALRDPQDPDDVTPTSRSAITQLQSDLKKLGFYTGPLDGRNDAAVTDAIKKFQLDARIPANGKCAERCQLALVKALTKP